MTRRIRFVIGPALLFVLLGTGRLSAQGLFHSPVNYSTGLEPRDVGAADLNGDARLDLAVVNRLSGSVSVLLNQGDGTFHPAVHFTAGTLPLALLLGTLDGDSYPDIVTSNSGSNSVSVLLNNGDGSFQAPVQYAVGGEPWGLALADFNGDEDLDVAVVNRNSQTVSILLNDGEGTLLSSGGFYAGGAYTKPSWLAAGDLDGDEDPDLVVVKNYHNLYFNEGYIEIFMNDGAGGFSSAGSTTIGSTASNPLVLDLDGDEDLDIAISGIVGSSHKLNVLLNDGYGNFGEPVTTYVGGDGRACAGDFDADGDPDVAISRRGVGASSFVVTLNDGNGGFAYPFTVGVGSDPMGLVSGDLDRDGDGDIAVAVSGENWVAVLMSRTDPTTAVGEEGGVSQAPVPYLAQNHPNPFNPSTTIKYWLPDAARVHLSIYTADGRLTRTLVGEHLPAGEHVVTWDGRDGSGRRMASGTYFYRLMAAGINVTRKLVLVQ